jgi:hypothetical protein
MGAKGRPKWTTACSLEDLQQMIAAVLQQTPSALTAQTFIVTSSGEERQILRMDYVNGTVQILVGRNVSDG